MSQIEDNSKTEAEESSLALKVFERDHIMKVLSENNWHRRRTAAALGINRKTLFRKMQKFGMIQPLAP
jgi:transcriptional regulator of acetoin/glycerol metabolism